MAAKTLEEIAKELKKMKFKSALFGGVDKKDVWKKIERLNDDYMQYIEQQRIGYEAVIADKERMIANGITVNAAQVVAGPGAMAPGLPQGMDPNMMGPYGDPSSAPVGAPSPQGEGFYAGPAMLPPGMDPAMLPPGMDPAMMGMPPMLDENGNPLPMPPGMMGMPPFIENQPPVGQMPPGMPPMVGGNEQNGEFNPLLMPGTPPMVGGNEQNGEFNPLLPPGIPPMVGGNEQNGEFNPLLPPGMPPMVGGNEQNGEFNPLSMPPVPPMPPFDPNFAPPAGGFEPNWDPLPMPGEAPAPPQQPAIPPYNPSTPATPNDGENEV